MDNEVPSSVPLISAVVCTYNRAELLKRALNSLAAQILPADQFEIILVDDGSTDATRAVATDFASRVPNFVALHQVNRGLGAARNAGWRAAGAPLIAFLDDDAIAPPDWLQQICRYCAAAGARVAVLGGPIDPDWETPPPGWLTRELMVWVSVLNLGREPLVSSEQPLFGGANMAFRAAALLAAGGFPEDLGRRGSSLLSHEEGAIWAALAKRGWTNAYAPDLRVRHFVAAARLTPAWFRRRLFWEGISIGRHTGWPAEMPPLRRLWRWLGIGCVRVGGAEFLRPLLQPWRWSRDVRWQTYCAYHWGFLWEMLRLLPHRPTPPAR